MQAFEEQISQLSFWKHNAQQHLLELEEENGGLKQRLQHVLSEDDNGANHLRMVVAAPASACQLVTQYVLPCQVMPNHAEAVGSSSAQQDTLRRKVLINDLLQLCLLLFCAKGFLACDFG